MTRVLNIANLQLGDTLVENHNTYVVSGIEQDKYCYDVQLLNQMGDKVNKCIPAYEQVIVEL